MIFVTAPDKTLVFVVVVAFCFCLFNQDLEKCLIRQYHIYDMIRAYFFTNLCLTPLGNNAGAQACWAYLCSKTRKPLSYRKTFLFVWLTCKECALLSVFQRQFRDCVLNCNGRI